MSGFSLPFAKLSFGPMFTASSADSGTVSLTTPSSRGISGSQEDRVGIVLLSGHALGTDFCGSYIGTQKKKICIRSKCTIASHTKPTSKASEAFVGYDPEEEVAFISLKADSYAMYTEPSCRKVDFGSSINRYLSDTCPVASWIPLFSIEPGMQPKTEEELADVISRTDLVMARGFTPRKKARFAPELLVEGAKPNTAFATLPETLGSSHDEVLSSLSIVWPTLQRNQQQLVDLVERMRSGTAQLAKELSTVE
eukprot:scaffold73962_cov36-Attheya_sp.AAC.2